MEVIKAMLILSSLLVVHFIVLATKEFIELKTSTFKGEVNLPLVGLTETTTYDMSKNGTGFAQLTVDRNYVVATYSDGFLKHEVKYVNKDLIVKEVNVKHYVTRKGKNKTI